MSWNGTGGGVHGEGEGGNAGRGPPGNGHPKGSTHAGRDRDRERHVSDVAAVSDVSSPL